MTRNEELLDEGKGGGGDPVEGKAGGELERENNCHQGHHKDHLLLHSAGHLGNVFFLFFGALAFGGLVLDCREDGEGGQKLEEASEDGEDVEGVLSFEVKPKELGALYNSPSPQRVDKNLVEGDEDNKLGNKGETASGGVEVVGFVKLELFLLKKLGVVAMLFFEGVELGLELSEFFGGAESGEGEGHEEKANGQGEENNRKPEVVACGMVEKEEKRLDGVIN